MPNDNQGVTDGTSNQHSNNDHAVPDGENLPQGEELEDDGRAERMGWVDKDDWDGDPDEWVDKEIFLATKPLFDRIKTMNKAMVGRDRKIDTLNGDIKEMMGQFTAGEIKSAKESRRDAQEDDDYSKVDELNDEIARLTAKQAQYEAQAQYSPVNPIVEEFKSKNPWYESDNEMRDFADAYASSQSTKLGGWDDSILGNTEKAVRRAFPDKFKNVRRDNPSDVGGGSRNLRNQSKYSARDLDDDAVKMMKVMERNGMSNNDYIKALDKQGYFGN